MSKLAHQGESVAEFAPDMTLVLKTLVPTLLVAVVLHLGATITLRSDVNLNLVLVNIDKITGNLTIQVSHQSVASSGLSHSKLNWFFFQDFYVEDVDTYNCEVRSF